MKRAAEIVRTRRQVLLASLSLPLAGCDYAPYGVKLSDFPAMLGVSSGLVAGPATTREQAAQIPFATIGYRIGKSPESMLILASKSQENSLWTSSERQAIVTVRGRIRQTAGFRWNLNGTNFVEKDPVGTPLLASAMPDTFERVCDFFDISLYQVAISSSFEVQGAETITVLESDQATIRVVEHCHCEKLNWDFDNCYWIDGDRGFVWRSIQTIHPNQQAFTIETLRPEL